MFKVRIGKTTNEDKLFKPLTTDQKSSGQKNDKRIAYDSGVDADGVIDPKVAKDEMEGNDLEEMSGMAAGGISGAMSKPLKTEDKLPGGIADDAKDSQFDSKQLEMGSQHEMEHTSDPEKAKEIAKDHLSEDPKYYTNLKNAKIDEDAVVGGGNLGAVSTASPIPTDEKEEPSQLPGYEFRYSRKLKKLT